MLVISGRGGIFYRTRFDPTMVCLSFEWCWFFKNNPSTFDFDTRDHWTIRKSPQVQLMLTSTMWPSLKSPWTETIKPCNHAIDFLGLKPQKGQTTKKFRRNHQPLQNIRSHITVMAVCNRSLNQMSATIKLLRYPKTLEGAVVRHFAVNYIILGSKSHPFHITAGMKIPSPSTSNLWNHVGSQLPPKTQQKTLHPLRHIQAFCFCQTHMSWIMYVPLLLLLTHIFYMQQLQPFTTRKDQVARGSSPYQNLSMPPHRVGLHEALQFHFLGS